MTPLEAIQSTYLAGGFWAPDSPDGHNVTWSDLPKLLVDDPVVEAAFRARSISQVTDYAPAVFAAHHRPPNFDGMLGPAMAKMLEVPRCYVPDHRPPKDLKFAYPDDPALEEVVWRMQSDEPAFGDGNWKGCHDVGQFHAVSVEVDDSGIGGHLRPVFKDVLTRVRSAYSKMGLLIHFIKDGTDIVTGESFSGRININFSFVRSSAGWIGLAIVGQNQGCGSNIWCRYLASYQGGDVVTQWVTLIKHELGHNTGMGHFSGRSNVMNPSIIRGLPNDWSRDDSSYSWLARRFGGEPVDVDDPGDPKPPSNSVEKRLELLEQRSMESSVKDAIQDAQMQWILTKLP